LIECEKHNPDIVIMDIVMPVCDGVTSTKIIKKKWPQTKVLILTTFHDDESLFAALENGADGFILKDMKPTQLILAIKSTAEGLNIFDENSFLRITGKMSIEKSVNSVVDDSISLSQKEKVIVKKIVDGKSNKEIAWELELSEGTVRNTVSAIFNKLNVKDRTQLAVYALKNGIIE